MSKVYNYKDIVFYLVRAEGCYKKFLNKYDAENMVNDLLTYDNITATLTERRKPQTKMYEMKLTYDWYRDFHLKSDKEYFKRAGEEIINSNNHRQTYYATPETFNDVRRSIRECNKSTHESNNRLWEGKWD